MGIGCCSNHPSSGIYASFSLKVFLSSSPPKTNIAPFRVDAVNPLLAVGSGLRIFQESVLESYLSCASEL
jgi:hypothetical protein